MSFNYLFYFKIAKYSDYLSIKYSDNIELADIFKEISEISVNIQKPCSDMWGLRDNKQLDSKTKRNEFIKLIQQCIDYDKNLLILLKEAINLID